MENIVYKIVDMYPIVDYPPALDETFKVGTKEVIDGVEVFTPQELQDSVNYIKNKESVKQQINEAKNELSLLDWINSKYVRDVQILKTITSDEYYLKYEQEYTKMRTLVALINNLELQLV